MKRRGGRGEVEKDGGYEGLSGELAKGGCEKGGGRDKRGRTDLGNEGKRHPMWKEGRKEELR